MDHVRKKKKKNSTPTRFARNFLKYWFTLSNLPSARIYNKKEI